MKHVTKYWKWISYQGVQDVNALSDTKRVILTNQISLTVFIMGVLSTLVFLLASLPVIWSFFVTFHFFLLLCIYLNRKHHTHLASASLIAGLSFAVFFLSCSFGSKSEMHLLFVPLILACGLLYNFNEKEKLLISALIPLFFLFVLEYTKYTDSTVFLIPGITEEISQKVAVIMFFLSVIGSLLIAYYYVEIYYKQQKSLLKAKDQMNAIYENSFDALFIVDIETRNIIDCNRRTLEMFEYDEKSELIGKKGSSLQKIPNDAQRAKLTLKALEDNEEWTEEVECITKKGKVFWGSLAITTKNLSEKSFYLARVTDITKRKSDEVYLKLMESVLVNAADAVLITEASPIDEPGPRIIYVNDSLIKMTGYSRKELIGKTPRIFQGAETERLLLDQIRRALINGKTTEVELINYKKNKEKFWVNLSIVPIANDKGMVSHFMSVQRDITDRKIAEKRLIESESKFRNIVETTSDWVWEFDEKGKYTYVSPQVFQILGYLPEEVIGKSVFDFMSSDEETRIMDVVKTSIADFKPIRLLVNSKLHKNGHEVIFETNAEPFFDLNNIFKGYRGIHRDITIIRQNELKLQRSQINFMNILNNTDDSIWMINTKYELLAFNRMFNVECKRVLGVEFELGQNVINTLPEVFSELKATWKKRYDKGFKGEQGYYEDQYEDKQKINYFDIRVYPIREEGVVTGLSIFSKDISKRKRDEKKMLKAKTDAEAANLAKSNFLANMSHEIRTPINGILGLSDIIITEYKDKELKNYANLISQSGQRLLQTISSILDISRIEAQKTELNLKILNVNKVIKENIRSLEVLAKKKNIYLEFERPLKNFFALLDEQLLHQILNNLIGNAIKFTSKGGVTVKLENEKESKSNQFKIIIADTGVGMSKEFIRNKIFMQFEQESKGQDRKYEGSGLGLSITKKMIELLEGSISVESKEGKGTIFYLTFQGKK